MLKVSRHTVKVGDSNVRYQMIGQGDPVILIHGLSGSTRWWMRNVQSLAQHHCVYLIDLPGFGSMSRRNHAYMRFALTKAGSWLLAWMDAISLKQAHFIGHSMGGYICMWIAAHRPDVVMRLVLVAPAVMPQVRSVFGYFIPLLITVLYLKPRFLPILVFDALRAGPLMLLRAAQDLLTQDVHEEMKAITAPTLLVWGENDSLVPPTLGHILRENLVNSRLLILKRAGHVSMFDQYQEFNEAVNAFLSGETVGE